MSIVLFLPPGGCDSEEHKCTCDAAWTGIGCEYPDCPGTPDCNDHGSCNASVATPFCDCNDGWIGHECSLECRHGYKDPPGSDNCVCDAGWMTIECNVECSEHGHIESDVCVCDVNWRGTFCAIPGCPGKMTLFVEVI